MCALDKVENLLDTKGEEGALNTTEKINKKNNLHKKKSELIDIEDEEKESENTTEIKNILNNFKKKALAPVVSFPGTTLTTKLFKVTIALVAVIPATKSYAKYLSFSISIAIAIHSGYILIQNLNLFQRNANEFIKEVRAIIIVIKVDNEAKDIEWKYEKSLSKEFCNEIENQLQGGIKNLKQNSKYLPYKKISVEVGQVLLLSLLKDIIVYILIVKNLDNSGTLLSSNKKVFNISLNVLLFVATCVGWEIACDALKNSYGKELDDEISKLIDNAINAVSAKVKHIENLFRDECKERNKKMIGQLLTMVREQQVTLAELKQQQVTLEEIKQQQGILAEVKQEQKTSELTSRAEMLKQIQGIVSEQQVTLAEIKQQQGILAEVKQEQKNSELTGRAEMLKQIQGILGEQLQGTLAEVKQEQKTIRDLFEDKGKQKDKEIFHQMQVLLDEFEEKIEKKLVNIINSKLVLQEELLSAQKLKLLKEEEQKSLVLEEERAEDKLSSQNEWEDEIYESADENFAEEGAEVVNSYTPNSAKVEGVNAVCVSRELSAPKDLKNVGGWGVTR